MTSLFSPCLPLGCLPAWSNTAHFELYSTQVMLTFKTLGFKNVNGAGICAGLLGESLTMLGWYVFDQKKQSCPSAGPWDSEQKCQVTSVQVSRPQQTILCLCQGAGERGGAHWLFCYQRGTSVNTGSHRCAPGRGCSLSLGEPQIPLSASGLLSCFLSNSMAVLRTLFWASLPTFKSPVLSPTLVFPAIGFGGSVLFVYFTWVLHS